MADNDSSRDSRDGAGNDKPKNRKRGRYKQYLTDDSAKVPRRTNYYWTCIEGEGDSHDVEGVNSSMSTIADSSN